MKHWLNDGFSEPLWRRDICRLPKSHEVLAQAIFDYAVQTLGSEPFQRESSRTNKSDGQTIFRTTLHRSFWLVLDTKSGGLQLHFPDKEDVIEGGFLFPVEKAPGTQWTRKKEKRITVPFTFAPDQTDDCLALVDSIHTAAVDYYSRGKDFSLTLQTILGDPEGGEPLPAPSTEEFVKILTGAPKCSICGSSNHINVYKKADSWVILCDQHHPNQSPWISLGQDNIPFEVKRIVWHRDGGKCVICGSEHFATFDHMIPANRGGGGTFTGSHLETNIRLKCRTCNYSKGNKLIP